MKANHEATESQSYDGANTPASSTTQDPEELREEVRRKNPNGLTGVGSGVSVERAEADFARLQQELSHASRASRVSRAGNVEKSAELDSGEPFDLESALRGGLEAEREAGMRPKHIGVCWDGLTVKGRVGVSNYVKTFPDVLVDFFDWFTPVRNMFGLGKKAPETTLVHNFKGLCKPGEMVLVLGKPGSGCTTFLKNITNQRYGYASVMGEVLYGPFTAEQFVRYRGEAVYNGEDDLHHATLTVEQTLGFAMDVKTPGKLPVGVTKKKFKEHVINLLLKMFNMEHTRNTVVGGLFVRGISGGERKRVSIAEMLISNACILSWDNSTRGLDASTALDFAKSLRVHTDLYKTSTFVSLYQASENIYQLFDKVLVMDEGREVYFGPASEARAYFEGLGFLPRPRQTTPDYVTGCTDEYERDYQEGRSAENAPHSAETLEVAFRASPMAATLDAEMTAYKQSLRAEEKKHEDFQTAVRERKRAGTSKSSVYSVGFASQVGALVKRQFVLTLQDKLTLYLAWIRTVVVAMILATLYLDLPETSASAFGKGGLLFLALLFNVFEALSELGGTMLGRDIVNKHRSYAFHRPSALWIAQLLVDQAFAASRIMAFSLIVYFATNLVRTAGAFFTFYLLILSANVGMTLFFRTMGCVSPDFDSAIKLVTIIIMFFITTCGYLIQWSQEKAFLRWVFYINISGLSFSALMANEFTGLNMTCTVDSLVPNGPGYDNMENQVCTLPGSKPGTLEVSGTDYLAQGFQWNPSDLWRNWGIVVALVVFFLMLNVVLGEVVSFGRAGNSCNMFQKPNDERKRLNADLMKKREEGRMARRTDKGEAQLSIESKSVLTWENLCYEVAVPGGTRRLLDNVFGYVKPGELTALMGASGAGKTTLLDVLAARKNVGVIKGEILVDGVKPGKEFQRSTSYAEQLDLHDPAQTVREALRFSADLRQPYSTPRAEKYAYVEDMIALLEMHDFADAIIGTPAAGLTVEQRKRVTMGVELAARPQLLLFLDEPTSGLDSQSAFNIVRFLKKLAAAGQAILCTIHQPNAALFENFDRLLLLKSGGRCVYFGDIGKDAGVLRHYLGRHGAVAKDTDNVAEFMLEAIGAGSAPRVGSRDWADIWNDSPELAATKDAIRQIKHERVQVVATINNTHHLEKEYASPTLHQLRVVMQRTNLALWRSPNYMFTRLFNHVVVALINGLTFLQLDDSRSSLQNKVFIIFQITVLPALVMSQVEPMYHRKRSIFFREQLSKMYSAYIFAASMVVAEVPYSILCAVCFFLPLYYLPGLQPDPWRAGYQFALVLVTELFSVTLGQMLAALTPSSFVSAQFDPFIQITFALFCGVTIPAPQMPEAWRVWLYELDPFTRLIGGAVTTALHQLPVTCSDTELNAFSAPDGMSCGKYMQPFFDRGGPGYIVDNDTSACRYCAYSVGDQFYTPLGMSFDNRWRDLGIFASFVGSNLIIMFLGTRFLNYNRR